MQRKSMSHNVDNVSRIDGSQNSGGLAVVFVPCGIIDISRLRGISV